MRAVALEAVLDLAALHSQATVGLGTCRKERHRMPFNLRNEGSKGVG